MADQSELGQALTGRNRGAALINLAFRHSARVLGALFALCLSLYSVHNTWLGMAGYAGHGVWVVFVTAGIQGLMFISAWVIASLVVQERPGRHVLSGLTVFFLCAGFSVFFAFAQQFVQLSSIESLTDAADQAGRQLGRTATFDLYNDVDAAFRKQHRELVRSQDYQTWKGGAQAVVTKAREAGPAIKETLTQAYQSAVGTQSRINAQIAAQDLKIKTAQATVSAADRDIVALEKQRGKLEPQVRDLETKLAGLQASEVETSGLMDKEKKGECGVTLGTKGCQRGEGPLFKQLRERLQKIKVDENNTQSELGPLQKQLDSLKRQLGEVRQRKEQAITDEQTAKGEQAKAKVELTGVRATLKGAPDLEGRAASFGDAIYAFEVNRDLPQVERARGMCSELLDVLSKQSGRSPGLSSAACDFGTLVEPLAKVKAMQAKMGELRTTCLGVSDPGVKSADAKTDITDPFNGLVFGDSLRKARDCIRIAEESGAGVPSVVAWKEKLLSEESSRRYLGSLKTESDWEQINKVDIALRALWDGNGQAYLALAIAIAVDLMILFSAIFSSFIDLHRRRSYIEKWLGTQDIDPRTAKQPPHVLALMRLNGAVREARSPKGRFVVTLSPALANDFNIRNHIADMINRREAIEDPAPEDGNRYYLSAAGRGHLHERLFDAMRDASLGARAALRDVQRPPSPFQAGADTRGNGATREEARADESPFRRSGTRRAAGSSDGTPEDENY
jgi:hypothetical protein